MEEQTQPPLLTAAAAPKLVINLLAIGVPLLDFTTEFQNSLKANAPKHELHKTSEKDFAAALTGDPPPKQHFCESWCYYNACIF